MEKPGTFVNVVLWGCVEVLSVCLCTLENKPGGIYIGNPYFAGCFDPEKNNQYFGVH